MQFVGLHRCCHELPLWIIHLRCRLWSQPQMAWIFWCCNNRQVRVLCSLFSLSFVTGIYLAKILASPTQPILSELFSSKPSFFHDDNRAGLFEVEPDSGKLLNADIQASKIIKSNISLLFITLYYLLLYFRIYLILHEDWKPKIKSPAFKTSSQSLPGTYFSDRMYIAILTII